MREELIFGTLVGTLLAILTYVAIVTTNDNRSHAATCHAKGPGIVATVVEGRWACVQTVP